MNTPKPTENETELEKLLIISIGQLMIGKEYPNVGAIVEKILPLITSDKQRLLKELMEHKTEYLDCKERPEQNWQNCTCDNAEAVPLSVIQNKLEGLS